MAVVPNIKDLAAAYPVQEGERERARKALIYGRPAILGKMLPEGASDDDIASEKQRLAKILAEMESEIIAAWKDKNSGGQRRRTRRRGKKARRTRRRQSRRRTTTLRR